MEEGGDLRDRDPRPQLHVPEAASGDLIAKLAAERAVANEHEIHVLLAQPLRRVEHDAEPLGDPKVSGVADDERRDGRGFDVRQRDQLVERAVG